MRPRSEVQIDPDAGIPDLIRRLTDDSKRLASDEVRLAKIEMAENMKIGARGALWLTLAFGAGVITLVALTIALASFIGWLANGHMWVGALLTGIIELGVAFLLIKKGIAQFGKPSYTFEETREAASATVGWVRHARAD